MSEAEAESDDAALRHGYQAEQLLMQAIREGTRRMRSSRKHGMDAFPAWNLPTGETRGSSGCFSALLRRSEAAPHRRRGPHQRIPFESVTMPGCAHLLHDHSRAIETLTVRVRQQLEKPRGFGHVERCRDYVRKHCLEKICPRM